MDHMHIYILPFSRKLHATTNRHGGENLSLMSRQKLTRRCKADYYYPRDAYTRICSANKLHTLKKKKKNEN